MIKDIHVFVLFMIQLLVDFLGKSVFFIVGNRTCNFNLYFVVGLTN